MTLSYETAVKLRDAGFPSAQRWGKVLEMCTCGSTKYHGEYKLHAPKNTGHRCLFMEPYLEELIEACGEDFRWLKLNKQNVEEKWMAQGRPHWKDNQGHGMKEPKCFGTSPSEAVAELYLSLHPKK